MITLKHIKMYSNYNGDADSFDRSASKKEKEIMKDDQWYLLNEFIQHLIFIKNGLASDSYSEKVNKQMTDSCDSPETIEELKKLAVKFIKKKY